MTRKQHNDESPKPEGEPTPVEVTEGRFAYEGLERVIHEKARLGIMASLVTHHEGVLFGDLKDLCSLTDGNLNRHLKVLTEAGFVEIWKGSKANRPQTLCRITTVGKTKFIEYVTELERVISDAAKIRGTEPNPAPVPHVGGLEFRL
jgi:DNA-binding MarR family transcriptional regulator